MQHYSKESKGLKTVSIVLFVIMMIFSLLFAFDLLGGESAVELFIQPENVMMPHVLFLVLWLLVCLNLAYFVIFQLGRSGYGAKKDALITVTAPFIAASLLIILWIVLASYNLLTFTLIPAVILCVMLNIVDYRLNRIRPYLYKDEVRGMLTPFSVFTAWMNCFLIVNIGMVMFRAGFDFGGISGNVLAIIGIGLLILINLRDIIIRKNIIFSFMSFAFLVLICYQRFVMDDIMPVGYLAGVGALVILLVTLNAKRKNINKM